MLRELGDFTPNFTPIIDFDVEEGHSGSGAIENTSATPTVLLQFYLSNSTLHNINVYTAAFGDSFKILIVGDIITDQIEIVQSYLGNI